MTDVDWGVSCPVCMEKYSATRYPIVAPNCGHSLCFPCGKKRNSDVCFSCLGTSSRVVDGAVVPWPSRVWNKNFALLELINLRTTVRREMGIDLLKCSECQTMEKRARMKICGTCRRGWTSHWEEREDEVVPRYVLCSFCCNEKHNGHVLCKFPFEISQLLHTTVSRCLNSVPSQDLLCLFKFGSEEMEGWEEKMTDFRSIKCGTYEDGLSIADTLHQESDLITHKTKLCLPSLRQLYEAITQSSSRLEAFKVKVDIGFADRKAQQKTEEVGVFSTTLLEEDLAALDIQKELGKYEDKIRELEQKNREVERQLAAKNEQLEAPEKGILKKPYGNLTARL